ncbi:hypothetical protein PBOR_02595 [Paenibacillus borealis]|uniref:Gram-positive cocci surface proteins LPxTG domain-containing protein n=1 Tax=Paenibacillus borealis TaxID=160799 RepID=A0A089L3E1_PAEBO|nr:hypothetical protein PBOR_02595 [Paenibacillus borealis]
MTDTTINDDPVPLGPAASPVVTVLPTAPQPVVAEPTPAPAPAAGPSPEEIIIDDEIPLGSVTAEQTLPQTGESSPAPYYITGIALAGLGLLLRRTARANKRK